MSTCSERCRSSRGFSREQLKLIAISAESRSLPEKLLLFDEGQLLHSAYVIVSGSLRGEHKVPGTDKVVRREIGPGVILGERALILDARAQRVGRVESRTRVLQIRKLMFRKLLQEHPEMATDPAHAVCRAMSSRWRRGSTRSPIGCARCSSRPSVCSRNQRSGDHRHVVGRPLPGTRVPQHARCAFASAARSGVTQTWSRRRPRSFTVQSGER